MNLWDNPNATAFPFCESPFFKKLLWERKDLTPKQAGICDQFNELGYVVIDMDLSEEFLNSVVSDMYDIALGAKKQEQGYHYNDNPRIFEGWKDSHNIRTLALNHKVMEILKMLYGRQPIPFQTINFIKGTDQPLHSDTIHFHSFPERWMAAVWVALEDIDPASGPLEFIPRSHKWPIYTFQDLNLPVPEYGKQFNSYALYENFLQKIVEENFAKPEMFLGNKGQALIWSANLLHGGSKVINPELTRLSQATHYYFEGCRYYSPMFSDLSKALISDKDLSQKKISY